MTHYFLEVARLVGEIKICKIFITVLSVGLLWKFLADEFFIMNNKIMVYNPSTLVYRVMENFGEGFNLANLQKIAKQYTIALCNTIDIGCCQI